MKFAGTLKVTPRGEREIVITRDFNAPRSLVWDALTKPEWLKRWLTGPPGWTMTTCIDDARPGGTFRWEWSGADGAAMAMSGTYREVVVPEKIVRTECFEFGCDAQAGEQVGTLNLTESDGKTLMTMTVVYASKEARDGSIASGMEGGMAHSYNTLDELLAQAS